MTLADRITAIEARADAATKGPWDYYDNGFDGGVVSNLHRPEPSEHRGSDFGGVHAGWRYDEMICGGEPCEGRMEPDDPNAAFIAAARSDVPALCAALKVACEALTCVGTSQTRIDATLASIERIIGGGK
jgi:hypothetical protein